MRTLLISLLLVLPIALVPLPEATANGCTNSSSGFGFGPVNLYCNWTCRDGLKIYASMVNSDPQQNIWVEARGYCDDHSPSGLDSGDTQIYCSATNSHCSGWSAWTTIGTPLGSCWGEAHETWDSHNYLDCHDGTGSSTVPGLPSGLPGGFTITIDMPSLKDIVENGASPVAKSCDGSGGQCVLVVPACHIEMETHSLSCSASTDSPRATVDAPAVFT